jgi:hypothetical protein
MGPQVPRFLDYLHITRTGIILRSISDPQFVPELRFIRDVTSCMAACQPGDILEHMTAVIKYGAAALSVHSFRLTLADAQSVQGALRLRCFKIRVKLT